MSLDAALPSVGSAMQPSMDGDELFASHPQPQWMYDPDTLRFLAVNQAAVDAFGWTESELLDRTILDIRPPDEQGPEAERLVAESQQRTGPVGRWRYYRRDGEAVPVSMSASWATYRGRRARLIVVTDLSKELRLASDLRAALADSQRAERELRASEERLRRAMLGAGVGLWEYDVATELFAWTENQSRLWGQDVASDQPIPMDDVLALIIEEDRADFVAGVTASIEAAEPYRRSFRVRWDNGELHWLECVANVHTGEDGAAALVTGTLTDVTARKQEEAKRALVQAQLAHEAMHDHLTGLPNRALLLERIRSALLGAPKVAVLFCDVDRFKLINDSRDHATGDTVLMTLASRLRRSSRADDTVARFGGDELVVVRSLLPGEQEEDVVAFAQHLRAVASRPIKVQDGSIEVSLSVGIAFGGASTSADELVRDADAAMYRAKELGRARVERYHSAIRTRMRARVALEARLRHALDRGAVSVAYQPLVRLTNGAICGFEALARWEDPELGVVAPDRFIPVAEETRLINRLGAQVLEQACAGAAAFARAGGQPLSISVNLSSQELSEPGLADRVARTAAAAGIHPRQLAFEVTESGVLHDLDGAVANLLRLQALGCRVALDDFGTGYSSLSHLKQLPLDAVKVDRAFVHELSRPTREGAADAAIVRAVVHIAEVLGHKVVAEGIEDADQLRMVRDLGVGFGQGYLFTRALPLGEALAFLGTWRPERAVGPALASPL